MKIFLSFLLCVVGIYTVYLIKQDWKNILQYIKSLQKEIPTLFYAGLLMIVFVFIMIPIIKGDFLLQKDPTTNTYSNTKYITYYNLFMIFIFI